MIKSKDAALLTVRLKKKQGYWVGFRQGLKAGEGFFQAHFLLRPPPTTPRFPLRRHHANSHGRPHSTHKNQTLIVYRKHFLVPKRVLCCKEKEVANWTHAAACFTSNAAAGCVFVTHCH